MSIETYLAGAGRDVASMVDDKQLKCTGTLGTPIYNLKKCRLTDEFFRAFATLILLKEIQFLGFHVVVLMKTVPLMYQLLM